MADGGAPRRDQRLLGQGTTRRCALFLVLVVTLAVALTLRAVRTLVAAGQDPDLLDTPDTLGERDRGLLPLPVLRAVEPEFARTYEAGILDNAEPIAVTVAGLLLLTTAALHLCGPVLRRRGLDRIGPDQVLLHDALLQLTRRAGVDRIPAFSADPRRLSKGAVAFGSAGRYCIALDNGLVALFNDRSVPGPRFTLGDRLRPPEPADGPESLFDDALDLCGWSSARDSGWIDDRDSGRSNDREGGWSSDRGDREPAHDDGHDMRADFSRWFQQPGDGAVFAVVVLHELAHLRSRDVELVSFVRSLWLGFLATTVLPYTVLLAWLSWGGLFGARQAWLGRQWSPPWEAGVVAVLVVIAYVAYTDVLRHRELCADLDAVDWGADPEAWSAVALEQTGRRMGPGWEPAHWHTEPDDGWLSLFTWARKARPLRVGTRPWHTHPGWWWRIRALKRPAHPTGPNGTWTQAVILTVTVTVLMHLLLDELAHADGLARLTSTLFYCGAVLCVSIGRPLVVHPAHPFRPQPRAFGAGARGRARRAALLGACLLLLIAVDPLGELFEAR
ncbi:hypothetical protein [Streptomyces sp. NPDC052114]|uniref:hypothetical protein n=1 Tax=unclassified Streptomyces TaxID=2593676 RepID=UPI0034190EB1